MNFFSSQLWIDLALCSLIGISLYYIVRYLLPDEQKARVKRRLGLVEKTGQPQNTPLLKVFYLFYTSFAPLLYVSSKAKLWNSYLKKQKQKLNPLLVSANLRQEISPDEFIALRFVLMLFMPLFYAALCMAIQTPVGIIGMLMALIFGFLFADLWLSSIIAQRKKNILKHLPLSLDILTLSVESGLDFIDALTRLTKKTKMNAFNSELQSLLRELRLGASRSEALKNMSDRLKIEEITSLCSLLTQTDQLGSSIGEVLRAQSDQLRSRRFQMAEVAGARASQLILLPLVFCILPAAICVLLGPAILNFLRGGFL